MSWGGHSQDMVNRFKDNLALNKRRHEIYERIQDANEIKVKRKINRLFQTKKASKSQLDKIKTNLQYENAEEKSKLRIALIIIVFVVAILVYGIFYGSWFDSSYFNQF